ncbi:MAG: PEP/pyruvate-binding domain-containing protein [Candidatus Peregrinibacteria bacterium]|nr:PEP/pyruvate-binding domain-containing protein [Candidatus Peregrinibacteria bacterium]
MGGKLLQSDNPGHISDNSLGRIEGKLEGEESKVAQKALRILREFSTEKIKDFHEVWQVMAAIRHLVYDLGLRGGPRTIEHIARTTAITQQREEGIQNPQAEENGEQFAERMRRIRTHTSLKALAALSGAEVDKRLGMIRARFKKPDLEHSGAQKYLDLEGKKMRRAITDRVPIDELLDIVRLAEESHSDPETQNLVSLARGMAIEFLIRNLVTASPDLIKKASRFFTAKYIDAVLDQMPDSLADGRIGGKSAGVLLAYAALEEETSEFDAEFAKTNGRERDPKAFFKEMRAGIEFAENNSRFIGSKIFEQVIDSNEELADSTTIKRYYIDGKEVPEGLHEKVQGNMLTAKFPDHIERQLWILFKDLHGKPIIVRSSSELEDRVGASFAGKYESVELANSSEDEKGDFEKFKKAVLQVYASVFSRDVMEYRGEHNLLIEDEEMGVLIQELNGNKHGSYIYPDFAIVAMSHATQSVGHNPKRGAMTVVAGLGEQAVTEGGRYVMLDKPRANNGIEKPQGKMTVISIKDQEKKRVSPAQLREANSLSPKIKAYGMEGQHEKWQRLTCKGVTEYTEIPTMIEYIIQKLKHQLGYDVDCEFTVQYNGKTQKWDLKLVQCRPQNIPENMKPSRMPESVKKERVVLEHMEAMNATSCKNITHLLYIDPEIFSKLPAQHRYGVSAYVNQVNKLFAKGKYLILTPLRWGSQEEASGLRASFADFSHAAGYMEIFDKGDISCSWGTHFLQDTMDAQMATGAFEGAGVNYDFLRNAPHSQSVETKQCPQDVPEVPEVLRPFIKIIDINSAYGEEGEESKGKWVAHIAQDNTGTGDERPSHVYIAKENQDLPVEVE